MRFYYQTYKSIQRIVHVYFDTFRIVLKRLSIGNEATLAKASNSKPKDFVTHQDECNLKNAEKQTYTVKLLVISKTLKTTVKLPVN